MKVETAIKIEVIKLRISTLKEQNDTANYGEIKLLQHILRTLN